MKAIFLVPTPDGGVYEYRDVARASPQGGQVLVKIHAAGTNRGELLARGAFRSTNPALKPSPGGIEFADSPLAAVAGVDAVVLVTEWGEFLELDWKLVAEAMGGTLIVDGRNALDPDAIRAAGLIYEGIGRR